MLLKIEQVYIFTTTEAASWLNITDLLPYTKYYFNITTQLNRTSNPDVWSESTNATVTTLEASRYYLLASLMFYSKIFTNQYQRISADNILEYLLARQTMMWLVKVSLAIY